MARPLRIEYENAFYHVMNRGRGRQQIFVGADYYQAFLSCLKEAHQRFGLEVHAYCLMGNHYHLLVKTPRGNLSRVMRHIDGVYTQRHNRLKKTDGSLFRGRYKAILVDEHSYLLQASRYIHRNPIELRTPLAKKLETYLWSSYPAYINQQKSPEWLYRKAVYGELGAVKRYQAYRAYVEMGVDEETQTFYQSQRQPAIWGGKDFKEAAHGKALSLGSEVSQKGIKEPIGMDEVIKLVAKQLGCETDKITTAKRGRGQINIGRGLAMKLCQDYSEARLSEMAVKFNVGHYSTVSQTIGRINNRIKEDSAVRKLFYMLSQDLTP